MLHRHRAGGENRLVVAAKLKTLPLLALDLLPEPVVGGAAGEVGGKLHWLCLARTIFSRALLPTGRRRR